MGFIYEVRWRSENGRAGASGAFSTEAEAIDRLHFLEDHIAKAGRPDPGYWVEAIDNTGCFELPPRPSPREKYSTRVEITSEPGKWQTVRVVVLLEDKQVAEYERNYAMLKTFEPFRQGDRDFALISPQYTATAVLDLASGEIIASEETSAGGFCPVGFYVPDWWDVHDGRVLPGSTHWDDDYEWPSEGAFGFVWGCVWGDDSSWKVQFLDLSEIQQGTIRRDPRFGYLRLGTRKELDPQDFIRLWSSEGSVTSSSWLKKPSTSIPVPQSTLRIFDKGCPLSPGQ